MENIAPIPDLQTELAPLVATARDYIRAAKATNTRRAYRSDWTHFSGWCQEKGFPALPAAPETVILYLTALAEECKVSTIARRFVALKQAHAAAGLPSPTMVEAVRAVMSGIRRTKGTARQGKMPTLIEDIRRMAASLPDGNLGTRDRALLLVGFAGAFRRSELVGLDREDCAFTHDGLVIILRRSKTDQEAAGEKIAIPYGSSPDTCAVRALQAWLKTSDTATGPLFHPVNRHGKILAGRLSDKAVARAVKRYALRAGLDPARFAGHSLRAGFVTAATIGGADERSIMNQSRHRSLTTMRSYIRDGNLFRNNAAARLGR